MRIAGPGDTPRDRLCAQLFQSILQRLAEKMGGRMPVGCMLAFQWPGEEGAKVLLAAADGEGASAVQMGVYNEIMSSLQFGAQALAEAKPMTDKATEETTAVTTGPGDTDDDDDEEEDEDGDDVQ